LPFCVFYEQISAAQYVTAVCADEAFGILGENAAVAALFDIADGTRINWFDKVAIDITLPHSKEYGREDIIVAIRVAATIEHIALFGDKHNGGTQRLKGEAAFRAFTIAGFSDLEGHLSDFGIL